MKNWCEKKIGVNLKEGLRIELKVGLKLESIVK